MCFWYIPMNAVKFVRQDWGGCVLLFDSFLVTASNTWAYTLLRRKHQRKVSWKINVKRTCNFRSFIPFSPLQKGDLAVCPPPVLALQKVFFPFCEIFIWWKLSVSVITRTLLKLAHPQFDLPFFLCICLSKFCVIKIGASSSIENAKLLISSWSSAP